MQPSHACLPRSLGAVLRPLSVRGWAVPLQPSHHRKAVIWSEAMGKDSLTAVVHKHPGSIQPKRPVLLFDVMDTVVYDPFFKEMPVFFQMSFQDLLRDKHPTAWVDFECGRIDEEQLCRIFFADGRAVDRHGLTNMLRTHYRFLDGMEPLLARLSLAGYEMHALSNYPVWWNIIEDKLRLSRFMQWTFVSCTGPMKGVRKPVPEAYQRVIDHLALPPAELLFIDDRKPNIQGAEAQGLPSVLFANAAQLEGELMARGLQF